MSMILNATAQATVETTDELTKAIESAQVRIQEVYADGAHTLIDSIPASDWLAWDATDENAIVADSDGLDGVDEEDALPIAA